jgi:hypothetical protein
MIVLNVRGQERPTVLLFIVQDKVRMIADILRPGARFFFFNLRQISHCCESVHRNNENRPLHQWHADFHFFRLYFYILYIYFFFSDYIYMRKEKMLGSWEMALVSWDLRLTVFPKIWTITHKNEPLSQAMDLKIYYSYAGVWNCQSKVGVRVSNRVLIKRKVWWLWHLSNEWFFSFLFQD